MFTIEVNEETSAEYTGTIRNEAGDPLPLASINAAVLTLSDAETGAIINGKDDIDVLNANGVTIGATDGSLVWLMEPADNPILDDTIDNGGIECHLAVFKITYNTNQHINHQVQVNVTQLAKVP
jgi:hypothetical protein